MHRRDQPLSALRALLPDGTKRAGRALLSAALTAAGLALAAGPVAAQQPAPKIWDVKLGTPVAGLPLAEFVDPACGTNGGPPSRVLKSFADFALCPAEKG